ncbi:hypothetical protein H8E07_20660 [bacterium]|nr:hypothetical protein [bacterium]
MSHARREIAAVLLTGLGNFMLADWLGLRLAFVVGACLFWMGFVAIRASANTRVLSEWGFTTRNLGRSFALLAPAGVLALSCFIAYGILTDSLIMHWHIVLILLLYPVWGLVQQFLIVSLLAGNLRKHSRITHRWLVLLTALVFAVAHAPSLPLALAAFFLAAVTTAVYLRTRNLWALGLFHGWFATGLYYFVLGRDPWKEVVSTRLWP